MKFNDLNLHRQTLSGIKRAGFSKCMPVQETVLPITLEGKDVMVQAKTGSGKTAVFVLTFIERMLEKREQGRDSSCLIIAPTRELAQQIASDAQLLSSGIRGFRVGCFFGGVGYEKQEKLLKNGCNIYVGTPGRLIEFMEKGKLRASKIDTFVIDEADRLFDMGFYPDIKKVFRMLRPCSERHTMLFSATLEMRVRELAWEFMNNPEEIEFDSDSMVVDKITQELYHVAKSEKFHLFLQLLAVEKPDTALVFTNSRRMATELSSRLKLNNYNCDYLSGDLSQSARDKALKNLKEGRTKILVATDVAARGLQIDDLPLVVNYDVPEDYENYVHRIGRTARAGKSGKAITLADEEFVYGLEAIEKYIKMKIPVVWPDNLPEVRDLSLERKKTEKPGNSAKPATPKRQTNTNVRLSAMSEEERMTYYRKKYGFEPVKKKQEDAKPAETVKPGFFARIFRRKRNNA